MFPANEPDAPSRTLAPRLLRWIVAAVALAAAGWIAFGWSASERDRAHLLRQAEELGLGRQQLEDLGRALARETDPGERRIAAARTLLAAVAEAGEGDNEQQVERLEAARELALAALADLPASWEASNIEGGATVLLRIRQRDTRLFSAHQEWERPLELARDRAPGSPEPARYLAAAYLEVWPALSPEKRAAVEPLVREAFTDEFFFSREFDRWVRIAGSTERAAELLPDDSTTWQRLFQVAAQHGELTTAVPLYERFRASYRRELESALRPDALTRASDPTRIVTEAVAKAPLGLAFVPSVERAIAGRPPGPVPPELATAAARWIDWAEPLCLLRDCPLAPETFARMASTAGGGLSPDQAAFAELAAGNRPRAELLARRSDSLWSELWGPYVLLSAKRHFEEGETAQACSELGQVHRILRAQAPFQILARRCGPAFHRDSADEPVLERDAWQAAEWVWTKGVPALALVANRPALAMTLTLREPQPSAAMLVAEWDGRELPSIVVAAGARGVRIPVEVSAGAHLLRLNVRVGPLPSLGPTSLE